jgi:WW domain-containing oxidoreductase
LAITCHLLKHNAARIITLSANEENAIEAIEQFKSWGDTSRVVWHKCDLKDLQQVDRLAKKLKEEEHRIDAVRWHKHLATKYSLTVFFLT